MNMDENSFDFSPAHVAAASRRFPARRHADQVSSRPAPARRHDLSYLSTARGAEFGRHAWDEAGHL